MSMQVDFSNFDKGFKTLMEGAVPTELSKGLFKAGAELLRDAIKKPKGAPKEFGDLWGSASIQGAGSTLHPLNAGEPGTFHAEITAKDQSISVGFNVPYAAKWHEVPPSRKINWTYDKGATDPGPKYLEMKMTMYKAKYMAIIAEHFKRLFKGGA